MLVYLSKQSKFAARVAGKKGADREIFLKGRGGEGGSNLCTPLLMQIISSLSRHFISLHYVDPCLDDTHL